MTKPMFFDSIPAAVAYLEANPQVSGVHLGDAS